MAEDLIINDRVTLPARDLSWFAVRASGKGGQNVNKVSSKVVLSFHVGRSSALSAAEKSRLRKLVGYAHLNTRDVITISSDHTRSQTQNLADARSRLRSLVIAALVKPKKRIATSPSRAAKQRRLENKRRQSQKKRNRSRQGFSD